MKKFILCALAIIFVFGLAACGNSQSTSSQSSSKGTSSKGGVDKQKLSKTLNVFNWSAYMPKSIIKGFEKKYGVHVVYSTYGSNPEMITKVKSGTVPYDLVVPSDYYVKEMIKMGLLDKINLKNIPNFKNISKQLRGEPYDPKNEYSVPYMYGTDGIIYNKKKVKKPTSYNDLLNPKYKGHVITYKNASDGIDVPLQQFGINISKPKQISVSDLKKAGQWLKKLSPNLLAWTSTPASQFVNGTAWIGAGYSGAAARAWKKNKNVGYVIPKKGGMIWVDNMAIPKTAKHKYTAEVFMNYILNPKVSVKLSKAYPYSNPNAAAVKLLPKSMSNAPGMVITKNQSKRLDFGLPLSQKKKQLQTQEYQAAKVNQ